MRRPNPRHLATLLVVLVAASILSSPARAFGTDTGRVVFRKEPYLIFPGVVDEMQVLWQLYATAPCTLDWGTDTTYSLGSVVTTEYGIDHQHTHKLTGLAPETLYFYRVRGSESRVGSLRAAPSPDATHVKFIAYGDTRTYPTAHDTVAEGMIATYQADPEYQTLAILTGDLVGNGDLETDWDTQFFSPAYENIVEFHANVPTQAARGNHERDAILYAKYFPYPFVFGRAWSFDYGPAHFIVVDQYIDYSPGSPQLTWIENDLAASDKPWKFMYYHDPGWSAGGGHSNETAVQIYLHPLCLEYNVQIAFAGHNHYYARADVEGIQHITTGGGGAPLRTPEPGYPYIVATAEAHHFCTIEIDGDQLTFEAIEPDGTVLDSFSLVYTSVPEEEIAPAVSFGRPAPNPFSDETALAFTLAEASHVELSIYDLRGRLVARVLDEDLPSGEHWARWDGLSESGEEVTSGVYFARAAAGGASAARKIVYVR